jgi:hypothetical protein
VGGTHHVDGELFLRTEVEWSVDETGWGWVQDHYDAEGRHTLRSTYRRDADGARSTTDRDADGTVEAESRQVFNGAGQVTQNIIDSVDSGRLVCTYRYRSADTDTFEGIRAERVECRDGEAAVVSTTVATFERGALVEEAYDRLGETWPLGTETAADGIPERIATWAHDGTVVTVRHDGGGSSCSGGEEVCRAHLADGQPDTVSETTYASDVDPARARWPDPVRGRTDTNGDGIWDTVREWTHAEDGTRVTIRDDPDGDGVFEREQITEYDCD